MSVVMSVVRGAAGPQGRCWYQSKRTPSGDADHGTGKQASTMQATVRTQQLRGRRGQFSKVALVLAAVAAIVLASGVIYRSRNTSTAGTPATGSAVAALARSQRFME